MGHAYRALLLVPFFTAQPPLCPLRLGLGPVSLRVLQPLGGNARLEPPVTDPTGPPELQHHAPEAQPHQRPRGALREHNKRGTARL